MEGESLEINAKTVEDAIKKATEMTGRSEEDLQITVVSEGNRGILGLGGEDAHILVLARPGAPAAEEPASIEEAAEETAAEADDVRAPRKTLVITPEIADEARNILLDLLDLVSMDTDVEIQMRDGGLVLEVIGEDLGLLIGRRGETLSSIQFLLNLILAKRQKKWARVIIDVEGYRARREQTLSGLARRVAYRVRETGQPIALEAMPAGERRIIHMALADNPHVSTGSVGEGDQRKVVISPKN